MYCKVFDVPQVVILLVYIPTMSYVGGIHSQVHHHSASTLYTAGQCHCISQNVLAGLDLYYVKQALNFQHFHVCIFVMFGHWNGEHSPIRPGVCLIFNL